MSEALDDRAKGDQFESQQRFSIVRSWVERESMKIVDYTRRHPPLISGDTFELDSQKWVVLNVNEASIYQEWPNQDEPKLKTYSDFRLGNSSQRAIAVVYPEQNKKKAHFLILGKYLSDTKQAKPSFQLIPVETRTREELVKIRNDGLFADFFLDQKNPTLLSEDTSWVADYPIRPITDISILEKNTLDEQIVTSLTTLRVIAKERDRMYNAWIGAWKLFPVTAFLGSAIGLGPSGGAITGLGALSAVIIGLSPKLFQQNLENFNKQLQVIIDEHNTLPGIRQLSTLHLQAVQSKS